MSRVVICVCCRTTPTKSLWNRWARFETNAWISKHVFSSPNFSFDCGLFSREYLIEQCQFFNGFKVHSTRESTWMCSYVLHIIASELLRVLFNLQTKSHTDSIWRSPTQSEDQETLISSIATFDTEPLSHFPCLSVKAEEDGAMHYIAFMSCWWRPLSTWSSCVVSSILPPASFFQPLWATLHLGFSAESHRLPLNALLPRMEQVPLCSVSKNHEDCCVCFSVQSPIFKPPP